MRAEILNEYAKTIKRSGASHLLGQMAATPALHPTLHVFLGAATALFLGDM